MKTENPHIPKEPFRFLAFVSRPYPVAVFIALASVVVASAVNPLVTYIFKRIIDSINGVSGFGPESAWFWVIACVTVGFVEALAWRASGFAGGRWAIGVRATARDDLTRHVMDHSYNFFSNRFAGAIANKIKNAADGVNNLVANILWEWLPLIIWFGLSFWLVFHTNAYIGAFFVGWVLVIVPLNNFLMKKKVPLSVAAQKIETKLQAQSIDMLTNLTAVRDYARRAFELANLARLNTTRSQAGVRSSDMSEWILTTNSVIEVIFTTAMMLSTIYAWSLHLITAGDIILILTLIFSIRGDLQHLGGKFNSFSENIAQIREGLGEVLEEHEIKDVAHAEVLKVAAGRVVFENVSFTYETKSIFEGLNLTIEPGQRVGLVGRSGAGKSTLMKILTRQYDLQGGRILIDGQDISQVKQDSLREAIGVVPQEPLLFHRSLKENIKYGKLSATTDEMITAAKQAQADQFIEVLPKKYETLVGERGVKLSGGERQRVAIARAFLKNAPILLLDEATSSLDSEGEKLISAALDKLMEGKTVIAIAHRLSTLRAMDRIIVMDNGEVVEDGSHEELLKLGGIYAELWGHQAGGFLKDA